ncbi:MAG: Mrp/NBP35 family ATP-binding protein [Odoribacteraceae bacterium]|jgi:ATP-binding protein involved in chromosome partitioning|nr:Mrp/NBP35 family ATP-binding protein [Odoribacteraceae bacterium]
MQERVKELLARVVYPGTSKSLAALGMVQALRAEGREVSFRLVFTRSGDPFASSLKGKCEALLREHGYAARAEVVFAGDLERPLSLERVRHVVAISSGKGGVGKSTVTSNLAVALVGEGFRVGIVDADIFGPSIPAMFGAEGVRPCVVEEGVEPVERHGVKLLSIGFFAEPGAATVWRGPMASNALRQMIEEGRWGELDFLLVDLPPGTSDIHLTLVQAVALSGAVVVSTPQRVALADAERGINMFESPGIDVPVLGIVENMSWFTPAELPDHRYYLFGREGASRLASSRGLPLLGQIPIVQGVMEGGESGRPAALDGGPVAGAFREASRRLVSVLASLPGPGRRVRVK